MKYFLTLLALITPSASCLAAERPFIDEQESKNLQAEDGTPWSEGRLSLPPYPREEDLVEFDVDRPQSRFRYFVDGKHLETGEDGVIRFSLVITADSGAWNVSFEGIRCGVRQYKTYAYGSGRGEFKPLKQPKWQKLKRSGPDQHLRDLRGYYLCDENSHTPFSKKEMLHRLGNTPARTEDSGFL